MKQINNLRYIFFLVKMFPFVSVVSTVIILSILVTLSNLQQEKEYINWEDRIRNEINIYEDLIKDPNIHERSRQQFENKLTDFQESLRTGQNPYKKTNIAGISDYKLVFLILQIIIVYLIAKNWYLLWNANMKPWYLTTKMSVFNLFAHNIFAYLLFILIISLITYIIVFICTLLSPLYENSLVNLDYKTFEVLLLNTYINIFLMVLSIAVTSFFTSYGGVVLSLLLSLGSAVISNMIQNEYIFIYYLGAFNKLNIYKASFSLILAIGVLFLLAYLLIELKIRRYWFK